MMMMQLPDPFDCTVETIIFEVGVEVGHHLFHPSNQDRSFDTRTQYEIKSRTKNMCRNYKRNAF